MNALNLPLPNSLHERARILARREGISINQLISTALAEKMAVLLTEDYFTARRQRASRTKFLPHWPRFQMSNLKTTTNWTSQRLTSGFTPAATAGPFGRSGVRALRVATPGDPSGWTRPPARSRILMASVWR